MKDKVTSYALYRWRYVLGYTIGGLIIIAIMLFNLFFVTGGIRIAEQSSAVASGALAFAHFDPQTVINLPYHVLQRASFALFDVSELSIKLPSLIIGLFAILGCYLLIASWFRRNVAVITTIIAATMPAMLYAAQDGTPTIYAIGISFWLLYAATCVSRAIRPQMFWIVLFFILLALNLYTPLGIWLNIAILSTIPFHPHIRLRARRFNVNHLAIAGAVGFVLVAPLVYSLTVKPAIGLTLLGIPTETPDIMANLNQLGNYYFGSANIGSSVYLEPLFPIATMLLVVIGIYRFVRIKYTARTYVAWLWVIILMPMLLLNPESFMMILPLVVIMIAMGIASLIREWYVLFPRNPYARIVGLIPLGVIVAGIAITNTYHYLAGYHYTPAIASSYRKDIAALDKTLARTTAGPSQTVTVVIPASQGAFYDLVARYDKRFVTATAAKLPNDSVYIIHGDVRRSGLETNPASQYIAVDETANNADRFYLYTQTTK